MSGHQTRYDAARQRAADARHNADEYEVKAKAARQAAVDEDSQARLIAREAWRRGLGVLEVRPVKSWPLGRLAGYKPPHVAPEPLECDVCGHEVVAGACSECSTLDARALAALDDLAHGADLHAPARRPTAAEKRLTVAAARR